MSQKDFHRVATFFEAMEWPIIPIVPNEKRPLISGWKEKASYHPSTTMGWFREYQECNIGLVTGSKSKIFVLDVDMKHGKNGIETLQKYKVQYSDIPETFQMVTPSNGYHFYFKYPDGVTIGNPTSPTLGEGLDIRGEGGYVLTTPSKIDGNKYRPMEGKFSDVTWEKIAEPPDWLVDLATGKLSSTSTTVSVPIEYGETTSIPLGERDDSLFKIASSLRAKKVQYWEAKKKILEYADRCSQPFDHDEAIKKLDSAYKYDEGDELFRKVQEINEDHFCVRIKGNHYVLRELEPEKPTDLVLEFMNTSSFKSWFSNQKISINGKDKSIGHLWLEHPERRQYDRGIIFRPGCASRDDEYNLWRGFHYTPDPDGCCDLYLEHIYDNIANGNKDMGDYIIKWMSHVVQRPHIKTKVALGLIGKKGTGKSVFVDQFGRLFGRHCKHTSNMKHLTGNFNSHLEDVILLNADEAIWGGDKSAEGQLKRIITESTIMIERKGVDPYESESFVNLIMTSNYSWISQVTSDERRFCFTYVGNNHQQDTEYFRKIINQMDNGGSEKLLHYLQSYDLKDIDITKYPKTDAQRDNLMESWTPIEKFWYDTLQNGFFGRRDNDFSESYQDWGKGIIAVQTLYRFFLERCKNLQIRYKPTDSEFSRELRKIVPDSLRTNRKRKDGTRPKYYYFPSLKECRKEFEDMMGFPFDWDDC